MELANNAQNNDHLANLRERVLEQLLKLESDAQLEDAAYSLEFSVQRTNDRKGWRDPRPFDNDSPYQDAPRVRVSIELELDDAVLGQELVEAIARAEREARSH